MKYKRAKKVFLGQGDDKFCFWLMRQAGRYLPEYQEIRKKNGSFLNLCLDPSTAIEVSLQPIRRFDCDVVILFSDILVVPLALGQELEFIENEGPRLGRIPSLEIDWNSFDNRLKPVFETLSGLSKSQYDDKTIMGFTGAPWTLALYMLEGKTSKNYENSIIFALKNQNEFRKLIDCLIESIARYCCHQIDSGADAIQIFDTWAGLVPNFKKDEWIVQPTKRIVQKIKKHAPNVPIVAFPKNFGFDIGNYAHTTGIDCVSLDSSFSTEIIKGFLPSQVATQGNLDPIILVAGSQPLEESLANILNQTSSRNHVINLGHGVLPHTPVAHVEMFAQKIRNFEICQG